MRTKKQSSYIFCSAVLAAAILTSTLLITTYGATFENREMALTNIFVPGIIAGWRAHHKHKPVGPAILQGIAGGLIMQKALEKAGDVIDNDSSAAWQAKIMMNLGASLVESAPAGCFTYRMDIGPIWLEAGPEGCKLKPALHASLAPLMNLSDGSRFDLDRSLRLGTPAFERKQKSNGSISGNGALAYSNANNLVTNSNGSYIGHELIHTFQYRRAAALCPNFSKLFPNILPKDDCWVDDSSWFMAWNAENWYANMQGQNRAFDIRMEKEAYTLGN